MFEAIDENCWCHICRSSEFNRSLPTDSFSSYVRSVHTNLQAVCALKAHMVSLPDPGHCPRPLGDCLPPHWRTLLTTEHHLLLNSDCGETRSRSACLSPRGIPDGAGQTLPEASRSQHGEVPPRTDHRRLSMVCLVCGRKLAPL